MDAFVKKSRLLNPVIIVTVSFFIASCSPGASRFDFAKSTSNKDIQSSQTTLSPSRGMLFTGRSSSFSSSDNNQLHRSGTLVRAEPLPHINPLQTNQKTFPIRKQSTSGLNRHSTFTKRIVVGRGDTLYSIARRHGITVRSLMNANGLTNVHLRLGQQLVFPQDSEKRYIASVNAKTTRHLEENAHLDKNIEKGHRWSLETEKNQHTQNNRTTVDPHIHIVAREETIQQISRKYGVTSDSLSNNNNIRNPKHLAVGTVLRIPRSHHADDSASNTLSSVGSVSSNTNSSKADTNPLSSQDPRKTKSPSSGTKAKKVMKEKKTVKLDETTNTSKVTNMTESSKTAHKMPKSQYKRNSAKTEATRLRWPVKGRILSGFGSRKDGTQNDGLNLSVPLGTDVHAAEDGIVAYAGSELKGYGNLILLRHENGWVTAYAHADKMLVERGDAVIRGQVIAKAGTTGDVEKPQLHFELRKGAEPVDPLLYLSKLE